MSVATARAAIVDTLKAIPDLEVYGWPAQNANLPMAHVLLDSLDPDYVLDSDTGRYTFVVRIFVGRSDQEGSTALLDPFLAASGTTVRGLINDDPTLFGQVDSCRLMAVENFGAYDVAGAQHLGVEFRLDVIG